MRKLLATLAVFALCVPTAHAAFPGQNGKIAFTSYATGTPGAHREIHVVNPDGTGNTQLTHGTAANSEPDWSPDGTKIVFVTERHVDPTACSEDGVCNREIYVMDADGSNETRLTNTPTLAEGSPAWTPDGTKVSFVSDLGEPVVGAPKRIYTMNADGTGVQQFPFFEEGVDLRDPAWSPDGSRIAFALFSTGPRQEGLYVANADGTGVQRICCPDTNGMPRSPDWEPNGQSLVIDWHPPFGASVAKVAADGSDFEIVRESFSGEPAWSPDSGQIVFFTSGDIHLIDRDGSNELPVTSGTPDDNLPDWQPIPVNAYPRPKGATPLQVSLVPAYAQCTSPNRTHGPPLAFGSCNPPAQTSDELTVGTADSNAKPTKSRGLVRYDVLPGAPATPADEADVKLTVELSDVYEQGSLADYAGELRALTSLRITDKLNTPHPGGPGAGTVSDIELEATVPCAATPDPAEGAGCNLTTTFDSLVPGTVTETKRSVWALGQAELLDASGDPFMRQGLFVP